MFIKIPRHPAAPPTYAVCFDPATILLLAGTALSAVSAIQQGQAANAQSRLQAGILEQQAERDRQVAESDEADFRKEQSRLLAKRRARLGASGVDPAAGSPLLVSEDIAGETELGALRIRAGGETTATRLEQEAGLERFTGRAARTAGLFRGGALLLTGASKTFGRRSIRTDAAGRILGPV